MNRRQFLAAATGGSIAMTSSLAAADGKPSIIELCLLQMRNTQDLMAQRTNDFLASGYLPALRRAGARHTGAFTNIIGEGNPRTLLVTEFPDIGAWEASSAKLRTDKELTKASDSYYAGPLPYVRKEIQLFRSFSTVPALEVPPSRTENRSHVFELRTYESNHQRSLARKIRMFDEGEIALFRKLGMIVVFFGEAIAGPNLPQLTYMLAYDDLAARDKAWSAFVSSPEWDKMKNQPGVSDGEIVSNISNAILRPLPFSSIK
jgi:NIPSNAP protein